MPARQFLHAPAVILRFMLDPFRSVQMFFVAVSFGWMLLLAQPNCLMCQQQYVGFVPRSDVFWTWTMGGLALVEMGGVLSHRARVRVVVMALSCSVWGVVSVLFYRYPLWVTADSVYPAMVGLGWLSLGWAAWRGLS